MVKTETNHTVHIPMTDREWDEVNIMARRLGVTVRQMIADMLKRKIEERKS